MCREKLKKVAAAVSAAAIAAIPSTSAVAAKRAAAHACRITLTALGSGGPMHGGGRGDSAYLLRAGSKPLLVVDMGGDTPTEIAKAGVDAGTIPVFAITHMHPDHVSGIPDYVWGEIQVGRKTKLAVIGPPASPKYRSAEQLFTKLFGADGAFPALSDLLAGKPFPMTFTTASGDGGIVYEDPAMIIRAMRVEHGDLPALAYRIEVAGKSIVLAGDQVMEELDFAVFAKGADLMVAHAMGDEASGESSLKHMVATPSAIGTIARHAEAKRLVLSHWLEAPASAPNAQYWSLPKLPLVIARIKRAYIGPIDVAHDLARYDVGPCGQ